jgi:hypothetical protein
VLLQLGYSEPPLFIGVPRLLHRNSYLWCVRVIIYERPMTDRIHRIHHVVEATTLRWAFEGSMREAAQEALALLRHEAEEQMEQSQYHHFPSRTREGAEDVVMPAGDRDHIGCFANQVKLILEMAEEYGLNHMGENDDDKDENDNDEGNAVTPPALAPAAVPEEIVEEEDPMENVPQELDNLDDLGDLDEDPNEGRSNVDEWFPQDGSNDRD